jgi:hypothetical protein
MPHLIHRDIQLTLFLQQKNAIPPSLAWDSSPYNDPALISSDSCDEFLPSPTSPASLIYPLSSDNTYSLSNQASPHSPGLKSNSTQAFSFGTFEDWMRWDDPSHNALSPTDNFFPELKLEPMSPDMSGLELQGGVASNSQLSNVGVNPSAITNGDDAAVFGEDPITEEPLFQTPNSLTPPPMTSNVIPPRENLHSTPFSWSRPIPAADSRRSTSYTNALAPSQESQPRSIAMPSQPQTQTQQYPVSPSSARSSSLEPIEQQSRSTSTSNHNRRKRKSSIEDDFELDGEDSPPPSGGKQPHPPVKKTAHNMIEKRYRTNLNDKIAALRDSVPSLRVMSKKNARSREAGAQEDLQGLTPAHKLNKVLIPPPSLPSGTSFSQDRIHTDDILQATVLSKATEYISHLEKRNKYLTKENASLKSRIEAFEILVMSRQAQAQTQGQTQSPNGKPQRSQSGRHQNAGRFGAASGLDGMI